jgi:hypothetical protein
MADDVSVDPFSVFPDEYKKEVDGLIWLGFLKEEIKFCGHTFVLRTLKPQELAAIAIAITPWNDTLAIAKVYNNAHVGMALVSIDGDSAFLPAAGPSLTDFALMRLNYVTGDQNTADGGLHGWHQPTLDYLYSKYLELEIKAATTIDVLRDFYERGRTPSTSSASDLIDKDSSNEQTDGVTPI